jgi:hypothetical protein
MGEIMDSGRIKKIIHRHEVEVMKKWFWWLNAGLLLLFGGITLFLVRQIFSADLFLLSPLDLTWKIILPLVTFGLWIMFAHLLALNSPNWAMWTVSGVLGLTAFLSLTPFFALVSFVVIALANALFMLAVRGEYHLRIKISPFQNVERGIHIFLDAAFILIALGVFILYGMALGQKGLQIPEPLLERTIEQALSFSGIKVTLKSKITFGEVVEQVAGQVTIPSIRNQLKEQKYSDEDIEKYLADQHQQILDETQNQFFGKLGIEGDQKELFFKVVQDSLTSASKKNLPLPIEVAVPGILAVALYLLLRSFAFLFIWIGQGFAWMWFHLALLLRLIKIERRAEDVELVRF